MFFTKKEKVSWILIFFGFLAFGILLSTVILIIFFNSKVSRSRIYGVPKIDQIAEMKMIKLQENYRQDLTSLINFVTSTDSGEEILKHVEQSFFAMRVPSQMRDAHMQAFLQVLQLRGTPEGEIKNKVLEILNKLAN